MGKITDSQCKQCRRAGIKLMLKGDRCTFSKCAMVKRNYPPGLHGVKGRGKLSDYGEQLKAKQEAKRIYGLSEKQFKNYYIKASKQSKNVIEKFLQSLELRLDNVVYRLGFAKSRNLARQLVRHGHFLINAKKVNIPSYQLKPKDAIELKEKSKKNKYFSNQEVKTNLEKHQTASWLSLDASQPKGKVLQKPKEEDIKTLFNIKAIIEFYSR